MHLFNGRDGGGPRLSDFTYPGGMSPNPFSLWQALLHTLHREKRPGYLLGEIVLAVLLLHVLALLWLFAPSEPIAQAKPLVMEVSLVAAPKQEPHMAQPAPPKPPKPKPKKKAAAKKKPVLKKPLPKDAVALPKPQETEQAAATASKSSAAAATTSLTNRRSPRLKNGHSFRRCAAARRSPVRSSCRSFSR